MLWRAGPFSATRLLWSAGEIHEPHEAGKGDGWPRKSTRRRKKGVEQRSREDARGFKDAQTPRGRDTNCTNFHEAKLRREFLQKQKKGTKRRDLEPPVLRNQTAMEGRRKTRTTRKLGRGGMATKKHEKAQKGS